MNRFLVSLFYKSYPLFLIAYSRPLATCLFYSRDDRQVYVRSVFGPMIYRLVSRNPFGVFSQRITRIHVTVEGWKITACDIDTIL
jgi:hypothetical protein